MEDARRVLLSIDRGVAGATLNRPEGRKAVDERLRSALEASLDQVADDPQIRALVLTGQDPAFCAGGDISAMRQRMGAAAGQLAGGGWIRQRRLHGMICALPA